MFSRGGPPRPIVRLLLFAAAVLQFKKTSAWPPYHFCSPPHPNLGCKVVMVGMCSIVRTRPTEQQVYTARYLGVHVSTQAEAGVVFLECCCCCWCKDQYLISIIYPVVTSQAQFDPQHNITLLSPTPRRALLTTHAPDRRAFRSLLLGEAKEKAGRPDARAWCRRCWRFCCRCR